jgi:vacuolar-type H+-ATPase subunit I/STV1
MKKNYKTKKYRKYSRTNFLKTYKGGFNTNSNVNSNINANANNNSANEIMNHIKEERQFHLPSLGDSGVFSKATNLAQGATLNAVDKLGQIVGVDLTNPQQTQQKLEQIKANINNPETIAKVKEILSFYSQYGTIALEAVQPFLQKLSSIIIEEGGKTANKFIDTGSTIIGNAIKEIPGVGLVVSLAQDAEKIGETAASVVNTGTTITTEFSDTINAAILNFNNLIKEKQDLLNRTQSSIQDFTNPLKNMAENAAANVTSNMVANSIPSKLTSNAVTNMTSNAVNKYNNLNTVKRFRGGQKTRRIKTKKQ